MLISLGPTNCELELSTILSDLQEVTWRSTSQTVSELVIDVLNGIHQGVI